MVGDAILRDGGRFVIGAVVEGVDEGALCIKRLLDMPVQPMDILFGVHAAGDAGLVGHDHDGVAAVIAAADDVDDAVDPFEILDAVEVVFLDIDNAVPVEEQDRTTPGRQLVARRLQGFRKSDVEEIALRLDTGQAPLGRQHGEKVALDRREPVGQARYGLAPQGIDAAIDRAGDGCVGLLLLGEAGNEVVFVARHRTVARRVVDVAKRQDTQQVR